LKNDDIVQAICKCRDSGKTRFIGYSGDNQAAQYAISMSIFDVLETSVNICDQRAIDDYLPQAKQANLGVVTKRTLANTCWRDLSSYSKFYAEYAEPYTNRLKKMNFTPQTVGFEGDWLELALRFTAWQQGVRVCITGSKNPDHIRQNIKLLEKGPLEQKTVDNIRELWTRNNDGSWEGQT
jgi:aryl-alcohol dehydrogenase-like predicted oxidoreductase